MECDQSAALVHELKTLFNIGVVRDLTDGQLLERFATDRSEAAELAFAVLVERHGPMVLRVCRSTLSGGLEVDDAFQATFLVLVQKARGLWVRDSLGPWLHQVAFRTASCARLAAARRRKHEERVAATRPEAHTVKTADLDNLLHQEIERLPERYRTPVILCDLEGCSHQQAARHLGWPVGTVKSRQARGREKLRDRLRRQGVTPNVALLGSGSVFTAANPVVPPALVESTTRSIVQFVTCQTAVKASTLSLAQEVTKAMSLARWLKTGSVLFVLGATVSGAGIYAQRQAPAARTNTADGAHTTRGDGPLTLRVTPGKLDLTIVERGQLDSARHQDVYSSVEGGTTIIQIVPDGKFVKKGETICELDSASLRDRLTNAQITVASANAEYQTATAAREVTELAVREFIEGTYKHELSAVQRDVTLAESAIQKAEHRLDRARRARQRLAELAAARNGAAAPSDVLTELEIEDRVDVSEQTIEREKAALELAKSRRELLEKYTKEKTIKALTVDVEQKRLDELAKQARWQLEQSKQRKLERQIAACKIIAPGDGTIVYANPPRSRANQPPIPQIEEGAQVRERQKILSVIDPKGPKLVIAKVRESHVDKLRRGMHATIRVDSFHSQSFDGTVVEIAPLPDAPALTQGGAKFYTTKVTVDNAIPELRPGMATHVEFLLAHRENALAVPVEAILRYDPNTQKAHVAVQKPGGAIELREVSLGLSSDKLVEIKQGIESGDEVMLNPTEFLTDGPKSPVTRPSTSSGSSRTPPDRKP